MIPIFSFFMTLAVGLLAYVLAAWLVSAAFGRMFREHAQAGNHRFVVTTLNPLLWNVLAGSIGTVAGIAVFRKHMAFAVFGALLGMALPIALRLLTV